MCALKCARRWRRPPGMRGHADMAATVRLVRKPRPPARKPSRPRPKPKPRADRTLRLIHRNNRSLVRLPYLPDDLRLSGLADVWEQRERPGRAPLLLRTGKNLTTVALTCVLGDPAGSAKPVAATIRLLRAFAAQREPLRARFATRDMGPVRVTGLTVTETMWDTAGQPVRATVDVELTAASDAAAAVGPVPRKKRAKPRPKPKKVTRGKR